MKYPTLGSFSLNSTSTWSKGRGFWFPSCICTRFLNITNKGRPILSSIFLKMSRLNVKTNKITRTKVTYSSVGSDGYNLASKCSLKTEYRHVDKAALISSSAPSSIISCTSLSTASHLQKFLHQTSN